MSTTAANLTYNMDQLKQVQAAAAHATILDSKEGIQQCTTMMQRFIVENYNKYMELKEEQELLSKRRLNLKQRQDEHAVRMNKERGQS